MFISVQSIVILKTIFVWATPPMQPYSFLQDPQSFIPSNPTVIIFKTRCPAKVIITLHSGQEADVALQLSRLKMPCKLPTQSDNFATQAQHNLPLITWLFSFAGQLVKHLHIEGGSMWMALRQQWPCMYHHCHLYKLLQVALPSWREILTIHNISNDPPISLTSLHQALPFLV